jgi:hypothetical protein
MDFAAFLSREDAERAGCTLARLRTHSIEKLALTGGLAVELHRLRLGLPVEMRALNDMDFLVDSFDEIPKTLAGCLLFRHVHPHDPPGKILMQCVDPEGAVRVDIFRAYGNIGLRARPMELCSAALRVVSIEDLAARSARLCMDLASGGQVPAKHARDFLRMLPLVEVDAMDAIWQEHRKPNHPPSFAAAAMLLLDLISTRKDLQIVPQYSLDARARCSRCQESETFPLVQAGRVLSLLGYC